MKKLCLILVTSIIVSGCATANIQNDPDTLVDDFAVLLTLGLYRGGF